jgi:hypothetical protein
MKPATPSQIRLERLRLIQVRHWELIRRILETSETGSEAPVRAAIIDKFIVEMEADLDRCEAALRSIQGLD